MPIPFIFYVIENGLPPRLAENLPLIIKTAVVLAIAILVKLYSSGASMTPSLVERKLHGKVVLLTGGTSGIGAAVALDLARRGAQLILLTQESPADPFVAEYVQDLRARAGNELVYAEQVRLGSLLSVRAFATRWVDNAPPRRLDMIILCATAMTPPGGRRRQTRERVEETWMVNLLANVHLLGLLSPAIRVQPFDRDVRIVFVTCSTSSYASSPAPPLRVSNNNNNPSLWLQNSQVAAAEADWSPTVAYARSKLALVAFGKAFQKHIDDYKRPDGLPPNARVVFADPGLCRTPGMRRWLTRGSLWGLWLYLAAYAFPWLLLKSPDQGAQAVLFAALAPELGRGAGGRMVKECREVDPARAAADDDDNDAEEMGKKLWEASEAAIKRVESEISTRMRHEKSLEEARKKKLDEAKAKEQEAQKEKEKAEEIGSLVDAIKRGKAKEGQAAKAAKKKSSK